MCRRKGYYKCENTPSKQGKNETDWEVKKLFLDFSRIIDTEYWWQYCYTIEYIVPILNFTQQNCSILNICRRYILVLVYHYIQTIYPILIKFIEIVNWASKNISWKFQTNSWNRIWEIKFLVFYAFWTWIAFLRKFKI